MSPSIDIAVSIHQPPVELFTLFNRGVLILPGNELVGRITPIQAKHLQRIHQVTVINHIAFGFVPAFSPTMVHIISRGHESLDNFIIHCRELHGIDRRYGFRDTPISENGPENIRFYGFGMSVPFSRSKLYRGAQGNNQIVAFIHPMLLTLYPIVNHPGTPESLVIPVPVRIFPFRPFATLMKFPQMSRGTVEICPVDKADTVVIMLFNRM